MAALNELHHLDTALRLLRSEDSNFLEKLSVQEWELVWAIVREMVLNTDMKQHLPFLEDMKSWRVDGQVPEQQCTSMEDISLIQVRRPRLP